MDARELERYLHEHIPLSRAMAVAVAAVEPGSVSLKAPLAPNINHRETVFGGSASALAILSAWSLLHTRMVSEGMKARLVIQRNEMDYAEAITGEFTASATIAAQDWDAFKKMFLHKGKARVAVRAKLACDGRIAGTFVGKYVALPPVQ